MKNLTLKVLTLITCILLFSCNSDNDEIKNNPEESAFFNISVGNKWVYKKYETNSNDPTQLTFAGIVDTIKIISIENIQGFTFAKKSSKKVNINNNTIISNTYSYVRINNLGHLIEINNSNNLGSLNETSGLVLHPGTDFNYTYNYDVGRIPDVVGNVKFNLYNAINMNVENNIYSVLPYNGIFTPSTNHPELISKTVEMNYAKNIGLVKMVCHSVSTNYSWEERLVLHQLK